MQANHLSLNGPPAQIPFAFIIRLGWTLAGLGKENFIFQQAPEAILFKKETALRQISKVMENIESSFSKYMSNV